MESRFRGHPGRRGQVDRLEVKYISYMPHAALQDSEFHKLSQRSVDEDTRILHESYRRIKSVPFLLEKWACDGIVGYSAVFLTERVADWSDNMLENFLREAGIAVEPNATITRKEVYTFVIYRFEA